MQNKLRTFRLLLFALFMGFAGCQPTPDDVYKVVKIKDGDTIVLLSNYFKNITVRLAGIDCPEKKQAYGTAAKQFTALLCFGKEVKMKVEDIDRYGRTVGTILLEDGRNLNYEIVKNGYGWQYTAYSTNPELARLEQYARQNRLGLWQDNKPVAPWVFRKKKTKKKPRKKTVKKNEVVYLTPIAAGKYALC